MSALERYLGLKVKVVPALAPGAAFVCAAGFVDREVAVLVRHMSEYALWRAGAMWHVTAGHCPSWSDATECRCMLGGDA